MKNPVKPKVLDTSGILRTDLNLSSGSFLITNEVLQEIKEENTKAAVDSAIRLGRIRIVEPEKKYIEEVRNAAKETGDLEKLSDTDIGIIAIALKNRSPIVTDDYSIQNVASLLHLQYEASTQEGIKTTLKWSYVCIGCGRKYLQGGVCSVCGTHLKRRATKSPI